MTTNAKSFLRDIRVADIEAEGRILSFREDVVAEIVASIEVIGLLTPIVLYRRKSSGQYLLVAGRHRLEAYRRCGFETIPSLVFTRQGKAVDHWRALAEVDENLIRRKLTHADRAKLTAERKRLMAIENPASVKTGRPKKQSQVGIVSFVDETANATGRSRTDVYRDIQRGEAIAADLLDRVRGTCLDKGTELDALAKLAPAQQRELIDRAARGEKVSATTVEYISPEAMQLDLLLKAWASASESPRRQFLSRIGVKAAA